jgi:hypothetical protein
MPTGCSRISTSKALRLGLIGLFFGVSGALGQVITVTDTTGWNPWLTGNSGYLTDPAADQQTGQGADDMVGDATTPGFQQKSGFLTYTNASSQVVQVESYLFRVRMNKYDSRGFGGNIIMGGDLNGDGQVDYFMKMSDTSQGVTLSFAIPTSNAVGANTSPSTTAIGSWVSQSSLIATATTAAPASYNYQQVTTGTQFSGTADAFVTFGVAFQTMQTGIQALTGSYYNAGSTLPYSGVTITSSTRMSFIAATSTQGNALNQDLYGTNVQGNGTSTLTWSQLGASTGWALPSGVVPEPATYLQIGALLLVGGGVAWRQRRRAATSAN